MRRRDGELTDVELIFDGPGELGVDLSSNEGELPRPGSVRLEHLGPARGGFESRGFGDMAILVNEGQTAIVNLHASIVKKVEAPAGRYNMAHGDDMLATRQGMPRQTSPFRC